MSVYSRLRLLLASMLICHTSSSAAVHVLTEEL
jgi:hypothetical protein